MVETFISIPLFAPRDIIEALLDNTILPTKMLLVTDKFPVDVFWVTVKFPVDALRVTARLPVILDDSNCAMLIP